MNREGCTCSPASSFFPRIATELCQRRKLLHHFPDRRESENSLSQVQHIDDKAINKNKKKKKNPEAQDLFVYVFAFAPCRIRRSLAILCAGRSTARLLDSPSCVSHNPVLHQWHLPANTTLSIPHSGGTGRWDQTWSKTRVAWKGRHWRAVTAENMSHLKGSLSYETLKILLITTMPESWPSYESFHYWLIFKRAWYTCLWEQQVWWMSNTSDLVL